MVSPLDMKQLNFIRNVDIIRSISFDEHEILEWIMELYCPDGFELDPTYSTGRFYGGIPKPKYKLDLVPQSHGVIQADSRFMPIRNGCVKTAMFDPPFVTGSRADGKAGIIKSRFMYYKNIPELWAMYRGTLSEFHRVLVPGGVLVFKCQDTIESGKQYLSHVKIINMAEDMGFYSKDLFILCAHNRIISNNRQFHARKYHSYFIVFIKNTANQPLELTAGKRRNSA